MNLDFIEGGQGTREGGSLDPKKVYDAKTLCDTIFGFAKEMCLKDGGLAATAFIIRETDSIILDVPLDRIPKKVLGDALKGLAKSVGAIGFAFVCEGWVVQVETKGSPVTEEDLRNMPQPSKCPDRVEVVLVTAEWKGKGYATRRSRMIRNHDDNITSLAECKEDAFGNEGTMRGTFAGFFEKEN